MLESSGFVELTPRGHSDVVRAYDSHGGTFWLCVLKNPDSAKIRRYGVDSEFSKMIISKARRGDTSISIRLQAPHGSQPSGRRMDGAGPCVSSGKVVESVDRTCGEVESSCLI
jgi:hypothetical protein